MQHADLHRFLLRVEASGTDADRGDVVREHARRDRLTLPVTMTSSKTASYVPDRRGRKSDFTPGPWLDEHDTLAEAVPKFGTIYIFKRKDLLQ